jgi:hypothetical protein
LNSLSEINEETIEKAKVNRIYRINREQGIKLNIEDIDTNDLIFRIMTFQHIPLAPPKESKVATKQKSKTDIISKFFEDVIEEVDECEEELEQIIEIRKLTTTKSDHIRVNFPPFQHYRLNSQEVACLIGKSHWKGDLYTGEFCKDHGQMTDTLARMLIKLCERVSTRANFRGYSYREDFVSQSLVQLCQVALQFNEMLSQNPFSFYSTVTMNSFLRILNQEKKTQVLRDTLLQMAGSNPSFSKTNNDTGGWNED